MPFELYECRTSAKKRCPPVCVGHGAPAAAPVCAAGRRAAAAARRHRGRVGASARRSGCRRRFRLRAGVAVPQPRGAAAGGCAPRVRARMRRTDQRFYGRACSLGRAPGCVARRWAPGADVARALGAGTTRRRATAAQLRWAARRARPQAAQAAAAATAGARLTAAAAATAAKRATAARTPRLPRPTSSRPPSACPPRAKPTAQRTAGGPPHCAACPRRSACFQRFPSRAGAALPRRGVPAAARLRCALPPGTGCLLKPSALTERVSLTPRLRPARAPRFFACLELEESQELLEARSGPSLSACARSTRGRNA